MIRIFRGWMVGDEMPSTPGLFFDQTKAFSRVRPIVHAFYSFLTYLTILLIPDWLKILGHGPIDPLWPIAWMPSTGFRPAVMAILCLFTGGAAAAAIFPQTRTFRILAFLGLFEYWAFNNSGGKIGHSLHLSLLVSFVLIFLPNGWQKHGSSREVRQSTLLVFWAAQAAILLTYSMAGCIKIIVGLWQLALGVPNTFMPDALARHIADRLQQTHSTSIYGSWLIDHAAISWPLMVGTLYLETFAIWAAFRPRLQPFFAIGLVAFHISSYFTMTILFPQNCFLLFAFLSGMPLLRRRWTWDGFFRDLPAVGWFYAAAKRRVAAC